LKRTVSFKKRKEKGDYDRITLIDYDIIIHSWQRKTSRERILVVYKLSSSWQACSWQLKPIVAIYVSFTAEILYSATFPIYNPKGCMRIRVKMNFPPFQNISKDWFTKFLDQIYQLLLINFNLYFKMGK
jgi:hypothetical protein